MIECGTDPNYCTINHHILVRDVDAETIPEFRARARATGLEVSASIIVFQLFDALIWVDDAPEYSEEA